MPYSQFKTIRSVVETFGLQTIEGGRFLPDIQPVTPSETLSNFLAVSLPIASSASEKARSEGIIYPVLLEVRRLLNLGVSLFSGETFDVDASVGLTGMCDFLLSRSTSVLEIQAPAVLVVEAKQENLKGGIGQCVAELVAAQRFNQAQQQSISTLYGAVSSGTQWRFLKLEGNRVTIDLTDYPLPPVEQILGFLVWMVQAG
jgi:hypothetical protein